MYHASPSPSTSYQNQNPPAQPQPQQLSAAQQAQVTNAAYQAQLSLRKRAATDNLLGESLRSASRSKRLGGGGLGSTSAGGQKASHRALPPSIQRQIPESALFNDLLKMERKLDWEIMRKRAEINEGGFNARASRVSASNATSIHVVKNWITWGKTMKFIGRQLRHERVEEAEQREVTFLPPSSICLCVLLLFLTRSLIIILFNNDRRKELFESSCRTRVPISLSRRMVLPKLQSQLESIPKRRQGKLESLKRICLLGL